MSLIPGTVPVAGKFAPTDSTDIYGLFDDEYFIGSHRTVITLSARNAITSGRRRWGMLATVAVSGAYVTYQLTEGTVDTDINNNANWVVFSGSGGAGIGIEPQTLSAAGTAITAPSAGQIKLVELNVSADTQYTGLAATGSGKLYLIKQLQEFAASFSVDIDDVVAGDTVLNAAGQSRLIWDVSAGVFKKLI